MKIKTAVGTVELNVRGFRNKDKWGKTFVRRYVSPDELDALFNTLDAPAPVWERFTGVAKAFDPQTKKPIMRDGRIVVLEEYPVYSCTVTINGRSRTKFGTAPADTCTTPLERIDPEAAAQRRAFQAAFRAVLNLDAVLEAIPETELDFGEDENSQNAANVHHAAPAGNGFSAPANTPPATPAEYQPAAHPGPESMTDAVMEDDGVVAVPDDANEAEPAESAKEPAQVVEDTASSKTAELAALGAIIVPKWKYKGETLKTVYSKDPGWVRFMVGGGSKATPPEFGRFLELMEGGAV